MEGILALMIPVLVLSTGLVAVLRMPREALAPGRRRRELAEAAEPSALSDEVAQLREELAQVKERLDFTERLLMEGAPAAARLAPPGPPPRAAEAAGA
jgi:hypothetical protein